MTAARKLAILIFDEVEVLDFCGPFEVFAVTRDAATQAAHFEVFTVAETARPILARNGLSVNPTYTFENCPTPDMILIPGGVGTRPLMHHAPVLDWIKTQAESAELVLSVCTGALLLAQCGLLNGLSATTYHTAFDTLAEAEPTVTLCRGVRYVDNGKVVTSAGISAGIDMSLYVVERLHGKQTAQNTAAHMEYEYYT